VTEPAARPNTLTVLSRELRGESCRRRWRFPPERATVAEAFLPGEHTALGYERSGLFSFTRTGRLSLAQTGGLRKVRPAGVPNADGRRETAGVIVRRTDQIDGRGVLVKVTAAGRALAETATGLREAQVSAGPRVTTPGMPAPVEALKPLRREAGDSRK